MSFNNIYDKKKLQEEVNRADPNFGDGSFLLRPEDTSIQGASEDFMKYLNDPFAEVKQNIADDQTIEDAAPGREMFDQLKGNNTPDLPQALASQSISQESGMSSKGPKTGSVPQEDILVQLKAARAANEASLSEASEKDASIRLANAMNKSFNKIGTGIANQAGYTKIASNPLEVTSDLAKTAAGSNKERLDGLLQEYSLKKGMDDTAYNRQKDRDARIDRLNDKAEDRKFKLDMLKAKSKSDKLTEDGVGQKELDKKFAADYNKFTSSGFVNATKGIEKLKMQRNMIEKESKERFGTGAGGGSFWASLPDWMRDNESIKMRDITVTLANNALKDTFGGQLSDKEREAKANEFYNDRLSPQDNLEILDTKLAELEDSLAVQRQKAEYFQKNNKSLKGFESNFSVDEVKKSSKDMPPIGTIIRKGNNRYKVINDNGDIEELK